MVLIWWYISDFFNFIFEALRSVFSWFNILIELIFDCIQFIGNLILVLPVAFTISVAALISVSAVYKIFGREAGN